MCRIRTFVFLFSLFSLISLLDRYLVILIVIIIIMFMLTVELEKQTFCDLKVVNNTQNYVAFKVIYLFTCSFPNWLPSCFSITVWIDFSYWIWWFHCYFNLLFARSKPPHLRSTLFDQTLVLYSHGIHVSSEVLSFYYSTLISPIQILEIIIFKCYDHAHQTSDKIDISS